MNDTNKVLHEVAVTQVRTAYQYELTGADLMQAVTDYLMKKYHHPIANQELSELGLDIHNDDGGIDLKTVGFFTALYVTNIVNDPVDHDMETINAS